MRLQVEKVAAGDLRIIFGVNEVTGGQVDGGEVGGELSDIHAEEVGKQQVDGARRERLPFAGISPDQEGAAAAGRVHDFFSACRMQKLLMRSTTSARV